MQSFRKLYCFQIPVGFHVGVAGSRILPLKFYINKTWLVRARSVDGIHTEASILFALELLE